ncbi:hypothetical protein G7Z17_g10152 [Cylindrodendrum hubeiense]|uniref:Helicase ATP-binding domain-containing protein n=1 Tax=Cylindrodendrum hubeiense TaxID=595255 RepID=A0A9P5LCM0_9HYPO|nr:hypothetical protein G7Z17_g10152 [Cylindrodendrum hubeiense]
MKGMRGLMHTTSVDAVNDHKTPFSANPIAGTKRSWSNEADSKSHFPDPRGAVHFQRAISLPPAPPRLSASRIVELHAPNGVSEYSQRRLIAATPTASHDPELDLAHPTYGLPKQLVDNFASLGIKQIYPWQKACLKGPGLLNGEKNLVYCAPTGGGKSLVADLLMLRRILGEKGSKALLVLPYVALVQEKVRWLRNVVKGLRYDGDSDTDENKSIWRRRADEGTVRVVGFFGGGKVRATWQDFDIGVCTLEKANALVNTAIDDCSIPQLRAVVLDELHMIDDDHRGYLLELTATKLLSLEQPVQIIGMSATLPNMDLMAQWLNGHCYETRYRPVPIEEHLVYNGKVYPAGSTRSLIKTASQLNGTAPSQGQITPTRRIEPSAHKEFRDPVLNSVVTLAHETASAGYGALVFAGSRSTRCLRKPYSSVLHFIAGLTSEERDLIAAAYDDRIILVCVATCSLAAGINLALLEVISIRLALSRESIHDYFSKSLLSHTHDAKFVHDCISSSLEEIEAMGFVTRDALSMFTATQLGKAIVASAIDPDDGVFVHKELSRALRAFVMDGEMHILYTFTPVQEFGIAVNWQVFRNEMETLDESGLRVLSLLGIKPTTVLKLAQGASLREITQQERDLARVYRRFYFALQLRDLCNEVPIHVVARKYDVPRGTVQNLAQTCQGFAAGMIKFCEQMGWGMMAAGLDHFSDRLVAGARTELLDLTKVTFIKSRTAWVISPQIATPYLQSYSRVFWENGFRTIATIANADPMELLPVLMQGKDNEKYEEKLMVKATVISESANKLWRLRMQAEIEEE